MCSWVALHDHKQPATEGVCQKHTLSNPALQARQQHMHITTVSNVCECRSRIAAVTHAESYCYRETPEANSWLAWVNTAVSLSADLELEPLHCALVEAFVQLFVFFMTLRVDHSTYAASAGTEVFLQVQHRLVKESRSATCWPHGCCSVSTECQLHTLLTCPKSKNSCLLALLEALPDPEPPVGCLLKPMPLAELGGTFSLLQVTNTIWNTSIIHPDLFAALSAIDVYLSSTALRFEPIWCPCAAFRP